MKDRQLFTNRHKKSPPQTRRTVGLLPDEDSNLDKQNQNLSYCLYTIGQNNFGMAAGSGQK
jgi:hypothetical protein